MDKTSKFLKRLSVQERSKIREIINNVLSGNTKDLNIKKLKGQSNIFRVRSGDIRIIFKVENDTINLIFVGRKNDITYKNLT